MEIAVTFPLDESTKAMDVSLDDHVPPVSPSVERVVVLPTISVLVPEIVPGFSGAQVTATSKLCVADEFVLNVLITLKSSIFNPLPNVLNNLNPIPFADAASLASAV